MSATLLDQLKPQMRKCFKSCRLSEVSGPGLGREDSIELVPQNVHILGTFQAAPLYRCTWSLNANLCHLPPPKL